MTSGFSWLMVLVPSLLQDGIFNVFYPTVLKWWIYRRFSFLLLASFGYVSTCWNCSWHLKRSRRQFECQAECCIYLRWKGKLSNLIKAFGISNRLIQTEMYLLFVVRYFTLKVKFVSIFLLLSCFPPAQQHKTCTFWKIRWTKPRSKPRDHLYKMNLLCFQKLKGIPVTQNHISCTQQDTQEYWPTQLCFSGSNWAVWELSRPCNKCKRRGKHGWIVTKDPRAKKGLCLCILQTLLSKATYTHIPGRQVA